MSSTLMTIDPELDLVLERDLDVPVESVWNAWTTPDSLRSWFVPRPWSITSVEMDLRPGGRFNTTMRSPEGVDMPNEGCYLEIVPNERLVFTDALRPGFRPAPEPFFTGILNLEPRGSGTHLVAIARHGNAETRKSHEEMGFHQGWGTVIDQMVEHINSNAA
jgi:uncharacterized protein YndB with AHSA1/START domain